MEISATFFKSIYDNKTDKNMNFSDWNKFEKFLYDLSKIRRKGKKDAQLMSPAIYTNGTTRANKNVIAWAGWAAIDVDDHEFKGDIKNELHSRFGRYYYVCYSTASNTTAKPKFRLVFPLKTTVGADAIKKFWYALNTEVGSVGDRQTKDLSRMYYIPAAYDSADNFIFTNIGDYVDPYALIEKHPAPIKEGRTFMDRLPDDLQKKVIEYKKSKLQNTTISWSGYTDCPFVNKKLIKEYKDIAHIDNTGRYAMIYRIMSSIAINALKKEYPISATEIEMLIRELDRDTSNLYENRPLNVEADRAIEYAYKMV